MHCLHCVFFAVLMWVASTCEAETLLQLASPDKQHNLLLVGVPSPDSPDVVRTSFSITDAQGRVIKEVGATEFPVTAVKWHKAAKALMVVEHISRQVVMRLIVLSGGEWRMFEVTQFKEPPDYFSLVNVESLESAFACYYLGRTDRSGPFTAYRTEVNAQSGDVNLVSARRVEDEELGFYKSSIARELHRISQAVKGKRAQYSSSLADDEPNWVLPGSDQN